MISIVIKFLTFSLFFVVVGCSSSVERDLDFKIKSCQLISEFSNNEVEADNKYDNKILMIEDEINQITNVLGEPTLITTCAQYTFDTDNKDMLCGLTIGSTVKIKGKFSGIGLSKAILVHCVIVK